MSTAKVHITKLAAAERQLRAAIRLYFAEEDELAIHTIASAAYRLLADLKAERGMDEAANVYLTSIFYVVRDYRRGTLPKDIASDPEFVEWVREVAEKLPIRPDSKFEDVSVTLPRELVGQFWNQRNKVANFLKHADRDTGASISLDEVDNLLLLMQCYSSYMDITRDNLGNEGFVFQLFIGVKRMEQSSSQEDDLVQKVAVIPEADRLRFCSMCISKLNSM
ncbi:MAG: hypothetical protein HY846_01020 [Nitrosomonadales bacterium]|nr:hypothetical protein [Nitrosomonadales bacterium]